MFSPSMMPTTMPLQGGSTFNPAGMMAKPMPAAPIARPVQQPVSGNTLNMGSLLAPQPGMWGANPPRAITPPTGSPQPGMWGANPPGAVPPPMRGPYEPFPQPGGPARPIAARPGNNFLNPFGPHPF